MQSLIAEAILLAPAAKLHLVPHEIERMWKVGGTALQSIKVTSAASRASSSPRELGVRCTTSRTGRTAPSSAARSAVRRPDMFCKRRVIVGVLRTAREIGGRRALKPSARGRWSSARAAELQGALRASSAPTHGRRRSQGTQHTGKRNALGSRTLLRVSAGER